MATEADVQQLILNEVGGQIPDTEIILDVAQVAVYWNEFAQFSASFELRRAYTKLRSIQHLLGQLRTFVNASIGDVNPQLGNRLSNLEAMFRAAQDEVQFWLKFYQSNRKPVLGKNKAKAPYEVNPICHPDPNLRRTRGDAVYPPVIVD